MSEQSFDRIEHRLDRLEGGQGDLKSGYAGLKADVGELKADVGELKVDVAALKVDVGDLKADVKELKANQAAFAVQLKESYDALSTRMGAMYEDLLDNIRALALPIPELERRWRSDDAVVLESVDRRLVPVEAAVRKGFGR